RTRSATPKVTVRPGTTSPIGLPTTTGPLPTTSPPPGSWPVRIITSTGTVQGIAPTNQDLYGLFVADDGMAPTMLVTPVRYDLASQEIISGTAAPGVLGSPA